MRDESVARLIGVVVVVIIVIIEGDYGNRDCVAMSVKKGCKRMSAREQVIVLNKRVNQRQHT